MWIYDICVFTLALVLTMKHEIDNSSMCENATNRFFWKGKRVSEKVYNTRTNQVDVGKNLRNVYGCKNSMLENNKIKISFNENEADVLEGRRIVHLRTFGKQLFCRKCKAVLSILDAVHEDRVGLVSLFTIKCQQCSATTKVATDKKHIVQKINNYPTTRQRVTTDKKLEAQKNNDQNRQTSHYDTNTRAALGTLNAGGGNYHLNKIFASLNMPSFHWNSFKTHEEEVGAVIQDMAQDSCLKAAQLERELTIKNVDKPKVLLPSHLNYDFIFPGIPNINSNFDVSRISADNIVRIAASFDTGWPTRGTGRDYNSMIGVAALIGFFSKQIISYVSLHRKCRMCEKGHDPKDHDCKLNFEGSAKAMEPRAAATLASKNKIFLTVRIELGFVISDNDSSSYAAIRAVSSVEVVRQSDQNHTSKGVTNELYKIKQNHKELNAQSIKYLNRCFSYALTQNAGDAIRMAEAIRNIPYHCFNDHQNCGIWCGYHLDPTNYKHSSIGDGFQDKRLFEALNCLFGVLASKTDRFAAGVSSNANESLNNVIPSKAPKSRFYGDSSSYDNRLGFAINKKNDGEQFIDRAAEKLSLSPGKHTNRYGVKIDLRAKRRYDKSLKRDFKKQRLFLKKKKTELRNKKECLEGSDTYRSDMGLLSSDLPDIVAIHNSISPPTFVFFDLETGGFSKKSDILQIAATSSTTTFSIYVLPTQKSNENASQVTGLYAVKGRLLYHGKEVATVTLSEALQAFYLYLTGFQNKCILVAHNCAFDRQKLMIAIEKTFLADHFKSVVYGFADTLPIIKKTTGLSGKGDNKLGNVSTRLEISSSNAHNAIADVIMLEQVLIKLGVREEKLLESTITWDKVVEKKSFEDNLPNALKDLKALDTCTSLRTRKKLVSAKISYELIKDTFKRHKLIGLRHLFGEDENGVVKVSKSMLVAKKIYDCLEKKSDL